MKATFSNSVDILVKAYFNDTLRHGNCLACAVGNLMQASGVKFGSTYTGPHTDYERGYFIGSVIGAVNGISFQYYLKAIDKFYNKYA